MALPFGYDATRRPRAMATKCDIEESGQVYRVYIEANYPVYPTLLADEKRTEGEQASRTNFTSPTGADLLGPITGASKITMTDILSLLSSISFGVGFAIIGFMAPLIDGMPNQYFWWTMACPALGIGIADVKAISERIKRAEGIE